MVDEQFGSKGFEGTDEVFTAQPEAENNILSSEAEDGRDSLLGFEVLDSDGEDVDESEGVIKVKYNKKKLKFTPKEAVPFVEMGLKWNSFREDYKKLAMLSNLHSYSVREFIEKLFDSNKAIAFKRALEECGGNTKAAELFVKHQLEKLGGETERWSEEAQKESGLALQDWEGGASDIEERQAIKARLISGFDELCLIFPGRFKSFAEVPADVVRDSIDNNRALTDSYLRFNFHELGNVKKALYKQQEIQGRSSGSLQGGRVAACELASFEKAFRSALK